MIAQTLSVVEAVRVARGLLCLSDESSAALGSYHTATQGAPTEASRALAADIGRQGEFREVRIAVDGLALILVTRGEAGKGEPVRGAAAKVLALTVPGVPAWTPLTDEMLRALPLRIAAVVSEATTYNYWLGADGGRRGASPLVRPSWRCAMSTAFAIGLPIEFKRGPGLGGWQRGVVVSDDGGRILEIRPARGGEGVMVRRLHVRVPEHPEAPVRTAQTVEMAGIPRRVIVAPKPLLPLPKPCGRIFAPVYLAFVRFQPCCSCDTERGVQAHHQGPRPVGRKTDDYRTCPLCHRCHQHLHRTGLLLGRPELLTKEAVMAYLRGVMVDLLIEYFASGAEEPTAPPLSLDQRYLALVESLTTEAIADVA